MRQGGGGAEKETRKTEMKNHGDSSHSGQDSGGGWERLTQQATRSEDAQQRVAF